MHAEWCPYTLNFRFDAQTSRETMRTKSTYFVRLSQNDGAQSGVGECALFKGLSSDDVEDYESILTAVCAGKMSPLQYSSIRFGMESAMVDMELLEDNPFTRGEKGIPINGLIWMGDKRTMRERIDQKLTDGFNILKLKIGGIDFEQEIELLQYIRTRYSASELELRLDANGSFTHDVALEKLNRLSEFNIHSIEQPIKAGQLAQMKNLCEKSPIPIALDEELIGCRTVAEMTSLLEFVHPAYIILKPALCGGLSGADDWITTAERLNIGWWATSALESNIGLEAIARWLARRTSGCNFSMPQGLGTGQLYHNNIESPLYLRGSSLYFDPEKKRKLPQLSWRS